MKDAIFWILFFVSVGCFYMSGRINGESSHEKEIATACSSGHKKEFVINGTTFHCGLIRSEVLAQTKKRRQEQLAETCTKYMMGLEQW